MLISGIAAKTISSVPPTTTSARSFFTVNTVGQYNNICFLCCCLNMAAEFNVEVGWIWFLQIKNLHSLVVYVLLALTLDVTPSVLDAVEIVFNLAVFAYMLSRSACFFAILLKSTFCAAVQPVLLDSVGLDLRILSSATILFLWIFSYPQHCSFQLLLLVVRELTAWFGTFYNCIFSLYHFHTFIYLTRQAPTLEFDFQQI